MFKIDMAQFAAAFERLKQAATPRQQLNFDALRRELLHAVHANLQVFEHERDVYAPGDLQVYIAPADADALRRKGLFELFRQKLEKSVGEHIAKRKYQLSTHVAVRLADDANLEPGYVRIEVAFQECDANVRRTIIRPPKEHALAVLEALNGPHQGDEIPLTRALCLIGRVSDESHPEIGIDDTKGYVSRRHAEIARKGPDFTLRDLRSSNGTWLVRADGQKKRVEGEPVTLESGIVIAIADEYLYKFTVRRRHEAETRVHP